MEKSTQQSVGGRCWHVVGGHAYFVRGIGRVKAYSQRHTADVYLTSVYTSRYEIAPRSNNSLTFERWFHDVVTFSKHDTIIIKWNTTHNIRLRYWCLGIITHAHAYTHGIHLKSQQVTRITHTFLHDTKVKGWVGTFVNCMWSQHCSVHYCIFLFHIYNYLYYLFVCSILLLLCRVYATDF